MLQIDKSLSFLDSYVQQSLEKGAQPYIPESERSGVLNVSNLRNQDVNEASSHALRFEAYELPKPTIPARTPAIIVPSTELVPVPEPSYARETHHAPSVASASDSRPSELRLRLDGVQKKWGKPSYSSASPSTSTSDSYKTNGMTRSDGTISERSNARESSYDSRKPQMEISPEKQKLAASLFGSTSKVDKKQSTGGHKASKTNSSASDKSHVSKGVTASEPPPLKATQPPLDLLDFGDSTVPSAAPSVDPFKQLEGLLGATQDVSAVNSASSDATKGPDLMSLYSDASSTRQNSGAFPLSTEKIDANLISGLPIPSARPSQGGNTNLHPTHLNKGPNLKDALEKDALVRQMGVTPLNQNPNLFSDLLS